jgi:AcrR family transcriptional regulator
MPRTFEANRAIRESQRANLLAAARRLIARGGSLTMEELAREAGVSQGLAYRYFRSKEALFQAMIDDSLRAATPWMSRVGQLPGGPREKLETIISSLLDRRRQNPEFYRFFFRALSEGKIRGRAGSAMRQRFGDFQAAIRNLILAGQRAGEIPPDDPDELELALIGCIQGIWRGMSQDSGSVAPPVIPRAEIVMRILGPGRAPAASPRPAQASSAA